MDLELLDHQEKGMAGDMWSRKSGGGRGTELAKPTHIYQSPLQRIGQALRLPQSGADAPTIAPTSESQSEAEARPGSESPSRETPNYSYKLLPHGIPSPTISEHGSHAAMDQGTNGRRSIDTGSIISPTTRAEQQTPRNKGYFAGTGLLSSFFSNPRTRAPFKPQKAGRGTSSWQLKQYAEATLGSGSLRKAVKLPEGEDKDEWLAVNGMMLGWERETYC